MRKLTLLIIAFFTFGLSFGQTVLIDPAGAGGFELGVDFPANGWSVINNPTNQWVVGTAAFNSGTYGAYISNDAGVSNNYSLLSTQTSHIYNDVNIPAGETVIQLMFNWKGSGETTWDRLLVYVAPQTVTPVAGTPASNSTTLVGATLLGTFNLQTTWQTINLILSPSLAGTSQRIIFTWQNDNSGGATPAIAVDNISLTSRASNPLQGIYSINNSLATSVPMVHDGTGNFISFTSAISYLNSDGIAGPVTFNVSAGQTFTEETPIITATGTSINTVTFVKSGVGSNPIILSTGASGLEAGIYLKGCDYFIFDGIDVNIASGNLLEYGYYIINASATDGAQYNTVKNCKISLNRTNTAARCIFQYYGTASATNVTGTNSNNTYQNINIENSYQGIYLNGTSATYPDDNCIISGCTIGASTTNDIGGGSVACYGLRASYCSNVTIFNNVVRNVFTTGQVSGGIFVEQFKGILNKISNNKVYSVKTTSTTSTNYVYGIRSDGNTAADIMTIQNNTINDLTHGIVTAVINTISIRAMAVNVGSTGTHNIYYNTVYFNGGSIAGSSALYITGAATHTIKNNIFLNASSGGATSKRFCIYRAGGTLVSNYNNFFNVAGTNNFIGYYTTDQATLVNWQAVTGTPDLNSISIDPMFVSATDLHFRNYTMNNFGTPISGITTDFDSETRNITTPDIGADEYDDIILPFATYIPANSSINVPVSTTIDVIYSENIRNIDNSVIDNTNVAGLITFTDAVPTGIPFTATWDALNNKINIIPNAALASSTQYTVSVASIEDTWNNADGGSTSTFTTGLADIISPLIDSAIVFNINPSEVKLFFNENVKLTDTSGVTIKINAIPVIINTLSGINTKELTFTLAIGINSHDNISFSYNPALGDLTDIVGNELATVVDLAVTNRVLSSAKNITDFSIVNPAVIGVISGTNITFVVPVGTDVTALVPVIAISNYATINPLSGIAQNFTAPVIYTVTAEDNSTIVYTVTVLYKYLIPYTQDFNAGTTLPPSWSGNMNVTLNHGTTGTNGLNRNMWSSTTTANSVAPIVGTVGVNCILKFDYRIVNYTGYPSTGTVFAAGNKIDVQVSVDNGGSFNTLYTIDNLNHVTSNAFVNKIVNLGSYANSDIKIKFLLTWASGDYYVDIDNFSILNPVTPTVTTATKSSITGISAIAGGNVTNDGYLAVFARGVCWGTSSNPDTSGNHTLDGTGTGIFVSNLTGLSQSTTYYYRAYATNSLGIAFGPDSTFTTIAFNTPTVSTTGKNILSCTSVSVSGNISTDGGDPIIESGIVYSTSSNPTVGAPGCTTVITTPLIISGSYTRSLTALIPGTTYFVRAYATNNVGTGYGTDSLISLNNIPLIPTTFSGTVTVCQGVLSAQINASTPLAGTLTTSFGTNLQSPGTPVTFNIVVPALLAGAVITGTQLQIIGANSINGSYRNEIRVALSGATTLIATQISTLNSSGIISPNPSITVPDLPANGGSVTLTLSETYNDGGVTVDATFGEIILVINYTLPVTTISWWDAATAGLQIGTGSPFETVGTSVLPNTNVSGTYMFYAESVSGLCTSNSRLPVSVIVNPVLVDLTPVDASCNGVSNGSFILDSVICGLPPFTYSVDAGSFGSIPSNLSTGSHTVIVRDVNGDVSAPMNITISQPTWTVPDAIPGSPLTVCQNSASAIINANPGSVAFSQNIVIPFNVTVQPIEVNSAPGNIIATADLSAIPAGSTITSVVLSYPGITALGGSWQTEVRLGISGAIVNSAASGTGAANSAGLFNYTRSFAPTSVDLSVDSVNLLYWDSNNDNAGDESTFPLGDSVATLTITYNPGSDIAWYDANTAGNLLGSGILFETVGTTLLPNTNSIGVYNFYAEGTYNGCVSSARVMVTVTVDSTSVGGTATATESLLCSGNGTNITLTGYNGLIQWQSSPDGIIWADIAGATGVTVATGTLTTTTYYRAVVTKGICNAQNSSVAIVTINPLPTADISGADTICNGQQTDITFNLTGTGPWTVVGTDGTTPTTFNITSSPYLTQVSPIVNTTYTLISVSDANCTGTVSDSVAITINSLPTATVNGTTAICDGGTADISIALTGSGPWIFVSNDGINDTILNATLSPIIYSVTPDITTTYTPISITDVNCTGTISGSATVTVNALPTVQVSGTNVICIGDSSDVTIALTGSGPWVFIGNDGNADTTFNVTSSPLILTVTSGITTTFSPVSISDANCSGTVSGSAIITVNDLPTAVLSGDTTICSGVSTDLSVTLTGYAPWSVVYNDGVNDSTVNNILTSPFVVSVNPGVSENYSLVSVNDVSCIGSVSGSASIMVINIPALTIVDPAAVCNTLTIDITTSSVVTVNTGNGSLTYWEDAATTFAIADPTAISVAGIYYIMSTNSCGSDIQPVNVSFYDIPVLTIVNPPIACESGTVDITSASVIISNTNNGVLSYWEDLAATIAIADPTVIDISGTFYVQSSNACGSVIEPVDVTFNPLPTGNVSVSGASAICSGDSTQLLLSFTGTAPWSFIGDDGSGQQTFNVPISIVTMWVVPSVTTTYTIISVTDGTGCTAQVNQGATVSVISLPIANLAASDTICFDSGEIIILDAGNTGSTYLWTGGSTSQTLLIDTALAGLGTHVYSVTVTNGICSIVDSISILVDICNRISLVETSNSISIYPNPTKRYLNISGSGFSMESLISIVNVTGQVVFEENIKPSNFKLDLSVFPKGIYFVKITNYNATKVERIILQ